MAGKLTPNAILKKRGSRHARADEPEISGELGAAPEDLPERERELWAETAAILEEMGTATAGDRGVLREYCRAQAQAEQAAALVDSEGMVSHTERGIAKHPAITIHNTASLRALRYAVELGLSPVSRGKLKAPEKKEVNPFDDI